MNLRLIQGRSSNESTTRRFPLFQINFFHEGIKNTNLNHSGLNAVQVYVPWNLHEVVKGRYILKLFMLFYNQFRFEFSGEKDLAKFIKFAQKADLDVLLRIGPYVCAEWENGICFFLF